MKMKITIGSNLGLALYYEKSYSNVFITNLKLGTKEKLTFTTIMYSKIVFLSPTVPQMIFSSYFKNSPVTFLVKVPTALCAVLLVTLRLVQAVGGALPHL